MEIFKQTNFDFLGKKWPFIIFSLVLTVAGLLSLAIKGGPKYGIDFNGGALMDVSFTKRPQAEAIRAALHRRIPGEIEVQEVANAQEVLISTDVRDENALEVARREMIATLDDLTGSSASTPLAAKPYTIRSIEIVGPKIGADLRRQAVQVVLIALAAMLVYIALRFEWMYGVAAVVAVFHDTIITIGLFSIFNKQIDLTVIAALLTLVGYSMNDTIVVFDRIRENLRLHRRGTFTEIVNASINQTLSRTVLTSGLTFLTAISLFLFGGQVLKGFSFALVVGIIVGTYSSIFVASPILVAWQQFVEQRRIAGVPSTVRR